MNFSHCDRYVIVEYGDQQSKSPVVKCTLDPVWNWHTSVHWDAAAKIHLTIKDEDKIRDDYVINKSSKTLIHVQVGEVTLDLAANPQNPPPENESWLPVSSYVADYPIVDRRILHHHKHEGTVRVGIIRYYHFL